MKQEEPWLRGPVDGVVPELQPVAHALLFAKEELDRVLLHVNDDIVWQTPNGAASIGFHVRHSAGSTLRMLTYLRGENLSEKQLEEKKDEAVPDQTLRAADLHRIAHDAIDVALEVVKQTPASVLDEPRTVGRKQLPSTVRGLLHEIAEHTARHIGQIVTTAKVIGG